MAERRRAVVGRGGAGANSPNSQIEAFTQNIKSAEFKDPNFNPQDFVRQYFCNNTQETITKELPDFQRYKERTAFLLKKKVHDNYQNFIAISKEVGNLEVDLLELRNQLTEFSATTRRLQQLTLSPPEVQQDIGFQKPKKKVNKKLVDDICFLLDLPDELDVLIAERRFDEAVTMIIKGQTIAKDINEVEVVKNIEARVFKLSKILGNELQNPGLKQSESKRIIHYLVKLGYSDEARAVFLDTRSKYIIKEIRKLKFEGDVVKYISELSKLVFSYIVATYSDFRHSFDDSLIMSAFVLWVAQELDRFAGLFSRQVFNSQDFQTMGKCLSVVKFHCTLFEDRGLSLSFFVERSFKASLIESINSYQKRIEAQLKRELDEESFSSSHQNLFDLLPEQIRTEESKKTVQMTSSGKAAYASIIRFIVDVSYIITPELLPIFIDIFSSLLEDHLNALSDRLEKADLTDDQMVSILATADIIAHDLIPRIVQLFDKQIKYSIHEEDKKKLVSDFVELYNFVQDSFTLKKASNIVNNKLDWGNMDYSQSKPDPEGPLPKFLKFFEYLSILSTLISKNISKAVARPIITRIIEEVVVGMADTHGMFWQQKPGVKKFGAAGLNQLVLDARFILAAGGKYITDEAKKAINHLSDSAIKIYCKETNKSIDSVLMPTQWFEKLTEKAIITIPNIEVD